MGLLCPELATALSIPINKMETEGFPACLNCESPVQGHFCSNCGQKHQEQRQSLIAFVREAFAEYFGVDGRFWSTSKALLFYPGRLTRAWLSGQRTKYLKPLRIYLIATVAFFFLLSTIDPLSSLERAVEDLAAPDTMATVDSHLSRLEGQLQRGFTKMAGRQATADSLTALHDRELQSFMSDSSTGIITGTELDDRRDDLADIFEDLEDAIEELEEDQQESETLQKRVSLQRELLSTLPPDSLISPRNYEEIASIAYPENNINLNLPGWVPQGNSLNRLRGARSNLEKMQAFGDLGRSVLERLPLAIFLMLPVFAMILKIVYIRRDYYYVEHLVFGLHSHAFAFTMFFLATALSAILGKVEGVQGEGLVIALAVLIVMVYYVIATKVVYQQGWIKTLFKILMISSMYNLIMMFAIVVAILLGAMLG